MISVFTMHSFQKLDSVMIKCEQKKVKVTIFRGRFSAELNAQNRSWKKTSFCNNFIKFVIVIEFVKYFKDFK